MFVYYTFTHRNYLIILKTQHFYLSLLMVGFFLFCSWCTCHAIGSNSSLFRNATSSEDLHNRLAGLKMEVTSRTSEISTQNQSVVVKTTTVISQQASSNGITTNGDVETQTTQQNASEQVNSEFCFGFYMMNFLASPQ